METRTSRTSSWTDQPDLFAEHGSTENPGAVTKAKSANIVRGLFDFFRGGRMKFKVGDTVQWQTTGRGKRLLRVGEIVAIVPPFADPDRFGPADKHRIPTGARRRETQSYLVLSDNRLYWPETYKLEKI